jgi:hypothetical protein
MSGYILRILVIALIGGFIFFGLRKIWRDWSGQFRRLDKEDDARRRARDLAERSQPGVIELTRDKDGTYRPSSSDDKR